MSSEAVKILGFRQTQSRQREQWSDKQKDGVTDSLINRQTDKKTDRQTDRQEGQQAGGVCGLAVEAERGGCLHVAGCDAKQIRLVRLGK